MTINQLIRKEISIFVYSSSIIEYLCLFSLHLALHIAHQNLPCFLLYVLCVFQYFNFFYMLPLPPLNCRLLPTMLMYRVHLSILLPWSCKEFFSLISLLSINLSLSVRPFYVFYISNHLQLSALLMFIPFGYWFFYPCVHCVILADLETELPGKCALCLMSMLYYGSE